MRIATIFGATGTQGSSVLNAVLKDGTFTPRVVTHNPNSTAGKVLKERGIEVVEGLLGNKDSVRAALEGSEVVFGVTNFWDPEVFPGTPNGEAEIEQGKNLVDAAKEVGVKFFAWSGLPNATTTSGGKYSTVYHFDNKAIIWEYLLASGIPAANVYTGWFSKNLWKMGSLVSAGAGYTIPIRYSDKSTQSFTWIERDLGPSVVALFKNYDSADVAKAALVVGKVLPVVSAILTYPEFAEKISAAIGKPVAFEAIDTHGLDELDVMFDYQSEFGLYKDTPVPNPDLVTFGVQFSTLDEFLEEEVVKRF